MIDLEQILPNERQIELIELAENGSPATAIRQGLREALAAISESVARLEKDRDGWKRQANATLSDHINGTPCAQIRWQQEREVLVKEVERLREALGFYADPKNWWNQNVDNPFKWHNADLSGCMESRLARVGVVQIKQGFTHPQWMPDCGRRARAALNDTGGKRGSGE